MNDEDQSEALEQAYEQGSRMAWRMVLQTALKHLGIDDAHAAGAEWAIEREEAIATLREVCRNHGDNDWPNDLNLADVIDKHLARHLGG